MAPTVTFLSDYGQADDFVGTCHGVMASICPEARILDITHGIDRHDVRRGALVLRNTLPYFPAGVHLAVVDPEVGKDRRAVALRAAEDGRLLVGPDNGLLSLAAQRFGGVVEATDIGRSRWRLEPVSATFHGRDIFAPVAARLAAGEPLAESGDPCDPDELAAIELPAPRRDGDAIVTHALAVDRFGNAQLDVSHDDLAGSGLRLGRPCELQVGAQHFTAWYSVTFADVRPGEILVYEDAYRTLAVAVNRGSAAALLGLQPDSELRIAAA
jgi:S-adenosyl-L-methionine hydrolase (adenosine-forming)